MSKMTKAQQTEANEYADELRTLLPIGTTIYTTEEYASSRASTAHVRLYLAALDSNGKPYVRRLTFAAAIAMGGGLSSRGGIAYGGYGYGTGFQAVYGLGRALYLNGFDCTGDASCHSNDHTNEWQRERSTDWHHTDGGYAFTQAAL